MLCKRKTELAMEEKEKNPKKSSHHLPSIIDLTKDHMNVNEMGKKALETHTKQQTETVKTLERLHKFLRKSDVQQTTEQPQGLKVSLLPHQLVGLAWLEKREKEKPAGGILADDMGLGKTLTLISLILKSKQAGSNSDNEVSSDDELERRHLKKGNTLVICPASVMDQWAEEIKSKVKHGYLSVCTHHGAKREKNPRRLAAFDVVITTYTIIQNENKGEDTGPLLNIKWKRVILDEAHTIRNHKSHTAQAVFMLRSRYKWALTGTPIHNKQDDLYSLLKFLKCKPFDDLLVWKRMIDNKGDSGMMRLHLLSKSLLLRRTKDEIQEKGGLKELRPKVFKIIEVTLDDEEFKVYNKIFRFSGTLLAQYIQQQAEKQNLLNGGLNIKHTGSGHTNPFKNQPELGKLYDEMVSLKGGIKTHHILVLLLRLRQTCCHPSLVTEFIDKQELGNDGIEDNEGNDLDLVERMMNMSIHVNGENSNSKQSGILTSDDPVFRKDRCSSKMKATIDCLMEIMNNSEDKVIVVSQWTSVLAILEKLLNDMGIKSVALNGKIPVKERGGIISDFNNNHRGPKVMLLSLTAGGTGLNLVGANHLMVFDIHWNPQLEAQACDRIYRVGQSKTVNIYKVLCKDTIEERILKLQNNKLELAKAVLTGTSKVQSSKLRLDDLKLLFNIK
ncbi:transcription termination factor 2 isoform X2 [Halyomorpha halys]|uniref:transcription termination factor 2 isoform X2 n=1 Tax=Halyomorpha halys TaxID=286706 RepID=UPI0006D50F1B|nr:transcription termination factor 2 isoform X2 [Halyomorpha halys]